MSTLDFPAIIARLHHGHETYGKQGLSMRQQQLLSGYKSFKLPEITRHIGVGDRGCVPLKNNDSFWRQPIYLDQVLRRRRQEQGFDIKTTYGSKYTKRKQPKFLPKLDTNIASIAGISAPYVRGQNVENCFDAGSGRSISFLPVSDEDEDAAWTRNALNGATSREIVRAYDKTKQRFFSSNVFPPRKEAISLFSNEIALPPITKHGIEGQILRDRSLQNIKVSAIAERSEDTRQPKVTSVSFELASESEKEVSRNVNVKANLFAHTSDPKAKSSSTSVDVYNRARPQEQSTFSHFLHQKSSPKTQAGKKLLSSLLLREENEKQQIAIHKKNAQSSNKPGAVLYSEEYLRIADSLEQEMKNLQRQSRNPVEVNKKFGVGIVFDKLPAELVGHHFQQTYQHLWKYLMQNGKSHLAKSYFPTKKDLQKSNPNTIYIPTGRLEETLCIEKVDGQTNEEHDELKQVKLKYCHRNEKENPRSNDTSPWDIEEEIKTPMQKKRKEMTNPPPALRETVVRYQSSEYANNADDGIRKVSITLPALEAQAPPCTPVSGKHDEGNLAVAHHSCKKDCGCCQPVLKGSKTHAEARNSENVIVSQYYPAHVKVIDFKKIESSPQKPKTRRKKLVTGKGPIPVHLLAAEAKSTENPKTRVYSHGQYHVKVEETIVRKQKRKLPKDMSNMFTKPYTFSYLTRAQAPCGLSSKYYTGKIANLALVRPGEEIKSKTSLVSEIRKPEVIENQVDGDEQVETVDREKVFSLTQNVGVDKKDASTQFNADEMSEKLDQPVGNVSMAVVSPVLTAVHEHELRVSPIPTVTHSSRKENVANKIVDIRPLSEGAKEDEITIYRSSVVKTYDASKFFRQADPKLL